MGRPRRVTDDPPVGRGPGQAVEPARTQPPSLLLITTVASTVASFLLPIAAHVRSGGVRVSAAANGATTDARLAGQFDDVHELPLSRSILDVRGMVRGERAIARILEATRPDIVHVHTPIASFLTRFAVRRMPPERRPAVAYTAHGFHFHDGGRWIVNQVFLATERIAGRWTDRLIVINDEDEAAVRRYRITSPRRLVRMPGIGLDTDRYARGVIEPGVIAKVRRQLGIPAEAPLFVIVGEFSVNKRQADGIAALARMRHREARLVLLGEGARRLDLERLVGRLGVEDRVVFAGMVDDVRPIVASAVALVLNSRREGLARSIMEALALETPVIASTARGDRELVGEDGFVVDVGDVVGFAAAMDWLIEHPAEGEAMGRRGRQRMVDGYDVRRVAALHETLYRAMLDERAERQASGSVRFGRASRR
jgi:glycosyltransferase involved in cell wall biosynthesis